MEFKNFLKTYLLNSLKNQIDHLGNRFKKRLVHMAFLNLIKKHILTSVFVNEILKISDSDSVESFNFSKISFC